MDQAQDNYHSQYNTNTSNTTHWPTWDTSQQPPYIPHTTTPLQPLDTTSYQLQGQRQYNTEFEQSSTQPQHQQQYHQQQEHQVYTSPMTPDNPSMYSSPMTPDHPSLYSSPMTPENPANMFSVSQELSEAVSRLELQHPSALPTRNPSRRNLRLSMDIQPFISITEPTPVQSSSHRHFLSNTSVPVPPLPQPQQDHQPTTNMGTSPELTMVDEFIAQHMAQLEQQDQQQQQLQEQQQQQPMDIIDAVPLSSPVPNSLHQSTSHDDLSFVKQELSTTPQERDLDGGMLSLDHASTGPEWLSWTPNRGNSPVSSEFELDMDIMMQPSTTTMDPFSSYTTDSVSATFSDHNLTNHQHRHHHHHHHLPHHSRTTDNIDTTRLNTGITTRPRRVSEPPRISNPLELYDPLDLPFNVAVTPPNSYHHHRYHDNNNNTTTTNDMMNFTGASSSSTASASLSSTISTMMVPEQSSSPRPIRRSHSDRRNSRGSASFPCQHPGCQKTFTRHYNLTSHMRTHTAERPFACTTCQRRFARQHDRNRHEKLHWGIKPFSCGNCQKSFARMDALNRHLRVENGCGSIVNNNNNSSNNVNNINVDHAMEYMT